MTKKELIYEINHEENFNKAQGMLEMFNSVFGTRYELIARRVVWFENPDASSAEKYASYHDAYVFPESEL